MTPRPELSDSVAARATLAEAFAAVRSLSTELAAPLSAEDCQVQSMDDVSPTKWHLGHVSWFFETFILLPLASGYQLFHPDFGFIFNSYYEAVGPRHARPHRGLLTRPGLDAVMDYRAHVDEQMARFFETGAEEKWQRAAALVVLGLHHEQQHQELLLTDIKHVLASQPLKPAYRDDLPPCDSDPEPQKPPKFKGYEGGVYEIGSSGDEFCFDNETPCHKVHVEDFSLAARPVTNGEFRAFIDDGGYENAALWLSDGWAWVRDGGGNLNGQKAPFYWENRDGVWHEFTLGGRRVLDEKAPVAHLTYYEADALARWSGKRLPTEAEWEIAARQAPPAGEDDNLLAAGFFHPVAQKGAQRGKNLWFYGDVWEWTASAYAPYPGFRAAPGAVGEYNGKFMVNQMVLRGGSCVTPPGHIRASYRNFFYPQQNWQFTGARLAGDA